MSCRSCYHFFAQSCDDPSYMLVLPAGNDPPFSAFEPPPQNGPTSDTPWGKGDHVERGSSKLPRTWVDGLERRQLTMLWMLALRACQDTAKSAKTGYATRSLVRLCGRREDRLGRSLARLGSYCSCGIAYKTMVDCWPAPLPWPRRLAAIRKSRRGRIPQAADKSSVYISIKSIGERVGAPRDPTALLSPEIWRRGRAGLPDLLIP